MLGMLGYGLMFYVDVAMAGHLGETALAASALASNLSYIPYVFGIGVVGAIAVYQSQDNGAGVEESSPAILRHGMVLAVAISVVAAIASHWAAQFIPLLGSSPAVSVEAREFFILMSWAMIPGLLFHALRGHRDSQHQPWISLAWLSVGILANILLNWLWMFGHWGFPAMGLAGAGWATLVARCVMLLGLWFTPGRGEVRWADGLQLTVFDRLLKTGWPGRSNPRAARCCWIIATSPSLSPPSVASGSSTRTTRSSRTFRFSRTPRFRSTPKSSPPPRSRRAPSRR